MGGVNQMTNCVLRFVRRKKVSKTNRGMNIAFFAFHSPDETKQTGFVMLGFAPHLQHIISHFLVDRLKVRNAGSTLVTVG